MKVKELIEELERMNPEMEVFVYCESVSFDGVESVVESEDSVWIKVKE
jgi:hypothetical protein